MMACYITWGIVILQDGFIMNHNKIPIIKVLGNRYNCYHPMMWYCSVTPSLYSGPITFCVWGPFDLCLDDKDRTWFIVPVPLFAIPDRATCMGELTMFCHFTLWQFKHTRIFLSSKCRSINVVQFVFGGDWPYAWILSAISILLTATPLLFGEKSVQPPVLLGWTNVAGHGLKWS